MPYKRGDFGPYPGNEGIMPLTAEENYWDGFWTAQHWRWPEHRNPGGPFYITTKGLHSEDLKGLHEDPNWLRYCAVLCENNRQWLRGFRDGNALHVAELLGLDAPAVFKSPGQRWAEYVQNAIPEGSFA